MTEQIIIDGVDVSGCEYCIFAGAEFPECRIRLSSFEIKCEGYNCYYKQLKRKETECEELKRYEYTYLDKFLDLKQALEEIREIAKSVSCFTACDEKKLEKIQAKINEVLK